MYVLYKNPIQLETLHIVQYLYQENVHFLPSIIIERSYPIFITNLPTILYNDNLYMSLEDKKKLLDIFLFIK
jgi:hypothetical protein